MLHSELRQVSRHTYHHTVYLLKAHIYKYHNVPEARFKKKYTHDYAVRTPNLESNLGCKITYFFIHFEWCFKFRKSFPSSFPWVHNLLAVPSHHSWLVIPSCYTSPGTREVCPLHCAFTPGQYLGWRLSRITALFTESGNEAFE